MKVNTEKLERLLISNWTQFLDVREMLKTVKSLILENLKINCSINSVVISRFELSPEGFLVWVEFNASNKRGTIEFLLQNTGELLHRRTVEG